MTDTHRLEERSVHPVAVEFLTWVADRPRTYDETMEAWRTSCPRLSVWEDSVIDGLVCLERPDDGGESMVSLTARGRAIVNGTA